MEIRLKTLTPLWTGGVDQTCDRLHETGLIGSLRWWYEALVRGLGGYACDPTSENPQVRCEFDQKAYEQAKKDGKPEAEAISDGLGSVCPVCYLFGTTGWARMFQLRAIEVPTTPLHFRTTIRMNQSWLRRVFGGKKQNIDSLQVPYGKLRFQFITRRYDAEYAKSQFALILRIAADYGGIGARLQHGFGLFELPPELTDINLTQGLQNLQVNIQRGVLRSGGPIVETPFDLRNFVSLTFEIPKIQLNAFATEKAHHIGNINKKGEERYIPCAFDLRYKGAGNLGMRQWLKGKGWKETTDPKRLEELDILLGPRSQWGRGNNQRQIDDDFRTASRVFFGMPYLKQGSQDTYILRVWAFWPPELQSRLATPRELKTLLEEYLKHVFGAEAKKVSESLGKNILEQASGGTK
jgi:CRISPR-associated protein Cmr1